MSNRAILVRTSKEWLDRLLVPGVEDEEGGRVVNFFFDEAEHAGTLFASTEYWGDVSYTLEGADPASRGPEARAYHGAHYDNWDGGAVSGYLDAAEVQATHAALTLIDRAAMARRWAALNGGKDAESYDLWKDIWGEFEELRKFYAAAAAAHECVAAMMP